MSELVITAGPFTFGGVFEWERAPNTCDWFAARLPFRSEVLHARWSGEAVWAPLGELASGLDFENHTAFPSRGELLFYPGGMSETEILFPYGHAAFAAKVGRLAGNHFVTIVSGVEQLDAFGPYVLRHGAQPIEFDRSA